MKLWWNGVREALVSFLGASRGNCLLCQQSSPLKGEELGLCSSCYNQIPWIHRVLCAFCGRGESCPDCRRERHTTFVLSRSSVRYDETMKELLARYKYRGDERLQAVLGAMLVHAFRLAQEKLGAMAAESHEVITFVPVSELRMQERGFNQAEQMALELGRRVGLPVVPLLSRSKHTDKQSFKGRHARIGDLANVFEVSLPGSGALAGVAVTRIYIVDDVYTTGSTMSQCARALGKEFSAEICGLTWAR
ncbi:ComF family protein [Paenibacillus whitsoniae]|uniref:ComF family protein n=1 Tax=Paenibacillus whitsoniae TaxID=2496558 RepID=A0A430JA96_9BACL|nr:ComF family protein [Paenibacillus whitsoniae]RTE07897.1 ComF family protein [Paenibacillus whitsoniae]